MPRRARKGLKRIMPPDAKYNSITVTKFINRLMLRGQKATAERLVYNALQLTAQQVNSDPEEALEKAIRNATPLLMLNHAVLVGLPTRFPWRSRRIGGALLPLGGSLLRRELAVANLWRKSLRLS